MSISCRPYVDIHFKIRPFKHSSILKNCNEIQFRLLTDITVHNNIIVSTFYNDCLRVFTVANLSNNYVKSTALSTFTFDTHQRQHVETFLAHSIPHFGNFLMRFSFSFEKERSPVQFKTIIDKYTRNAVSTLGNVC